MARWWIVVVLLVGMGCARQPKPATRAPQVAAAPLPWWAPKEPSPEFLRAARVIRAWPEEVAPGDFVARSFAERYRRTLPAAWEVFGRLSDQQIARLLRTREIHLAYRDLTKEQRAALLHCFEVYRKTFEGVTLPESEGGDDTDPLVVLYKHGAKEDLSNVDVAFFIRRASKTLVMDVRPRLADGTLGLHGPMGLGLVYDESERPGAARPGVDAAPHQEEKAVRTDGPPAP